jgi:prenyl protein peptidase
MSTRFWKNHINPELLQAPPMEEIVFRGCVLAVLHLAGVSKTQLLFLSPLSFGLGALRFVGFFLPTKKF